MPDVNTVIAVATVGIFIFTGTLWWSTHQLGRAAERQGKDFLASMEISRRSADVAEATLIMTNRPWLNFQISEHESLTAGPSVGIQVKLTIKNIGESPAINIQAVAQILSSEDLTDGVKAAVKKGFDVFAQHAIASNFGSALFPEDSMPYGVSISASTKEEIHKLMFVCGVTYAFAFGERTPRYHAKAYYIVDIREEGKRGIYPAVLAPNEYRLALVQSIID